MTGISTPTQNVLPVETGDLNPQSSLKALPTVAGGFVSAIVASALGYREWGALFFGAGMFSWLALESIIIYRLYLFEELPKPLRPTLGIQLAPPVVGIELQLNIQSEWKR